MTMTKEETIDLSKISADDLPSSVKERVGGRLLDELARWAGRLQMPTVEMTNLDLSRAASFLVSCSGRATREESVCAMLGWLLVTAESEGITGAELSAMLDDVVGLRAAARRRH